LIKIPSSQTDLPTRKPTLQALNAFSEFQKNFQLDDPWPAIEGIAKKLNLGDIDSKLVPQVALYRLLEKNPDVTWVRDRIARNATLLTKLAEETWLGVGTKEEHQSATAGILSAGSFARPEDTTDVPPLLSVRLHAFFRGISGLWACMNPNCSEIPEDFKTSEGQIRPIGKIYTEPRPWCDCGARVLEIFTCRHCEFMALVRRSKWGKTERKGFSHLWC